MSEFFSFIASFINKLVEILYNVLSWVLDGIIYVLKAVVYLTLDGLFTVVTAFFQTLDFSAFAFSYAAQWASLPPQMIWLINALGLPQCLSILAAAYLIRLALNLIPAAFTRV